MDIDTLYPLVTEAIRRAEALEDPGARDTRQASSEVSRLEERIAKLLPLSDYEGVIARRGAVRAAINAQEFDRAQELAARFEGEEGVDDALATDLAALKAQAVKMAAQKNRSSKNPNHRTATRNRGEIRGRVSAVDLTQDAIVRVLEAATVAHGVDRKVARKAAKQAASDLLGGAPPTPKRSV